MQQTATDKPIKLRDAIRKVLDQAAGEGGLRVANIWELVEALGAKTKSPDPHRQVEDALHRLAVADVPEAKRVGRGLWVRA